MHIRELVIAIDGPAASGKSTTAKHVADRLGYLHIDTGAMYRAITLKVLKSGIKLKDVDRIAHLVSSTHVELQPTDGSLKTILDGEDVTEQIRRPEVTRAVSAVSSIPQVRQAMVREQRRMGEAGGIVLEGRDIGTVVFPDADLKIFMVATLEARAHRRKTELEMNGRPTSSDAVMKEIEERDWTDSTRSESPLRRATDAVELDTSDLSIEEQVDFVVTRARAIIEERKKR